MGYHLRRQVARAGGRAGTARTGQAREHASGADGSQLVDSLGSSANWHSRAAAYKEPGGRMRDQRDD